MIRFIASALMALTLLSAPATAQSVDLSDMTVAERTAFRAEVRAYLLDNPEVILEAVQVLENRQADAAAQADVTMVLENAQALFDDGFSWEGGNPDGDIVLVEFMDYRCPYCRRALPEVANLLASDGNIRLIMKEFPILGDASVLASRFAIATKNVAGPDAYKEMHETLMNFKGDITEVSLRRISDGMGLDSDAIIAEMDSDETTSEIARTSELARRLQISGTPTFVLQDEMLRGFVTAGQMAAVVADKRAAN